MLLVGFLGTLAWLCMTGAVMFFGWLEAVSHPIWILFRRLGEHVKSKRTVIAQEAARAEQETAQPPDPNTITNISDDSEDDEAS